MRYFLSFAMGVVGGSVFTQLAIKNTIASSQFAIAFGILSIARTLTVYFEDKAK